MQTKKELSQMATGWYYLTCVFTWGGAYLMRVIITKAIIMSQEAIPVVVDNYPEKPVQRETNVTFARPRV